MQYFQIVKELLWYVTESFGLCRLRGAFFSWLGIVSFLLGFIGLFFTPTASVVPSFLRLGLIAISEELTWRTLAQGHLEQIFYDKKLWGLSYANILISLVFASLHIFSQDFFGALLTFFPSLVMGHLWTKFQSTWACALIHLWYNIVFWHGASWFEQIYV